MRSLHKKASAAGGDVRTLRTLRGAGGATDQQSRQLSRLGAKMGNQQMAKSGGAESVREALLKFIVERLGRMRAVQKLELDELDHVREWYREVADGKAGMWLPEPTRWHEAARLFKDAADALCRGNLEQAALRLERAIAAEEAAYGALPTMVKAHLPDAEQKSGGTPPELPFALNAGVLPPCKVPDGVGLADEILAVTEIMETPPPRRMRPRNWWEPEAVDEDEEKKDDDKKDGEKTSPSGERQGEKDDQKDDEKVEEKAEERAVDDAKVKAEEQADAKLPSADAPADGKAEDREEEEAPTAAPPTARAPKGRGGKKRA